MPTGRGHDLLRPLDVVAFLDAAVVAEDHDADIVALEVQRHAAHAGGGELHHLAGLHAVEAVHAGDTVAHRQHLADVGDFGFGAEVLDLLLQDLGDFCRADVHGIRRPSSGSSGCSVLCGSRRRPDASPS